MEIREDEIEQFLEETQPEDEELEELYNSIQTYYKTYQEKEETVDLAMARYELLNYWMVEDEVSK